MKKRRVKIKGYRPQSNTLSLATLEKYLYDVFTIKGRYVFTATKPLGLVYEDGTYEIYQVADNVHTGRAGWELFNKTKNTCSH